MSFSLMMEYGKMLTPSTYQNFLIRGECDKDVETREMSQQGDSSKEKPHRVYVKRKKGEKGDGKGGKEEISQLNTLVGKIE